jgi:tyrosine-protein phosphatase SIW14
MLLAFAAVVLAAAPPAAKPCDDCVPGVINFAQLDGALWRGAQPTAEGFKNLEKMGARTIVSFRYRHDDRPALKGTGLKYVRLPSRPYHPTEEHLAAFLKIMEDPANWPVFIHCAQGRDRTGYNAAAYRMVVQGWEPAPALAELRAFHFNDIWVNVPGFVASLNKERLKQRILAEPPPVFQ